MESQGGFVYLRILALAMAGIGILAGRNRGLHTQNRLQNSFTELENRGEVLGLAIAEIGVWSGTTGQTRFCIGQTRPMFPLGYFPHSGRNRHNRRGAIGKV